MWISPVWVCTALLFVVSFSIQPVSPAPWVHVSAFSRWNSLGHCFLTGICGCFPAQGGHWGDVAGHHCQMTAPSTCRLWSLQTGGRNWHGPFSSYCLVLLCLVVWLYLALSPKPSLFYVASVFLGYPQLNSGKWEGGCQRTQGLEISICSSSKTWC